jgi:hypothetical protein
LALYHNHKRNKQETSQEITVVEAPFKNTIIKGLHPTTLCSSGENKIIFQPSSTSLKTTTM